MGICRLQASENDLTISISKVDVVLGKRGGNLVSH